MPESSFTYAYPRPALTVDALVFRKDKQITEILLIRRRGKPFKDCWAFPGGFIEEDETVEEAIVRELKEETQLEGIELKQFYTASKPGRDPRGWTISVLFYGFLKDHNQEVIGGDDAIEAKWIPINAYPKLAFDHGEILQLAIEKLNREGLL